MTEAHAVAARPPTSLRPFRDSDEPSVVRVWQRSGAAAYRWLEPFTLDETAAVFRDRVRPDRDIWVGLSGGEIVAFFAIKESFVDRMYVDPAHWRQGWGTRLVVLAKDLSPDGLRLFTHADNRAARSFYEKHGFKPVRFFTSELPDPAPYVTYDWQPDRDV